MAAGVTETGCELGGALGIAVLGSLVVAAYRQGIPGRVSGPVLTTREDVVAAPAG